MKNDPHLIESEIPILEGGKYRVLCGKEIERAKFVCGWDVLEMGVKLRTLPRGLCSKCQQKYEDTAMMNLGNLMKRRFLYAIRSAKKDEEEIEAA